MTKLTSISSIGGFLFGYDTGIVSGAILYFEDTWPDITSQQTEFIVSIAMLGAFMACLLAGPASDKYGRKPVIIIADILFAVGSLLMAMTPTIQLLIVGRLLIGFGIGLSSIVIPIYLAEISPNEIRGTVVGINATFCPIGQFISSIVALKLRGNWRLMLGLAAIPSFLQLLGMVTMPESQRWLAKKKRHTQCLTVLKQVYKQEFTEIKHQNLKDEVQDMKHEIQLSEGQRIKQLCGPYLKCVIVGCGL